MEQLDQIVAVIALTMGVAWASGINLYAALLVLGVLGGTGHMVLPAELQIVTHPLVIFAAGAMYLIEFGADKVPGVDNSWDALHTFIRIPAGAALAAAAVGPVDPAVALAAAILGGVLTAGTHATKAGTRILLNGSPEPFSNGAVSLGEDLLVVAGLWTALHHPLLFVVLLALFVVLMIWLLPKLWRGVKALLGMLRQLFRPLRIVPEEPAGASPGEQEARRLRLPK